MRTKYAQQSSDFGLFIENMYAINSLELEIKLKCFFNE